MGTHTEEDYGWFVKRFGVIAAFLAVWISATLYALYLADVPYTNNDVMRKFQMERLGVSRGINTVIVGDSSAGNAISEGAFSEYTGTRTMNIALTGSFGIEGSYNMVRQALRFQKDLKYVLIVQTLDIWHRPFSDQGALDTWRGLPSCPFPGECRHLSSFLQYLFNPKEVWWAIRYLKDGPPPYLIADNYLAQKASKPARGDIPFGVVEAIPSSVDSSKRRAFLLLDELCAKRGIVCVYLHGPLREEVLRKSEGALAAVHDILDAATAVRSSHAFLVLQDDRVGDSSDHVAPAYKRESTLWYAGRFNELIGR